jgi:two-component system OmpR family response regulator
VLRDVMVRSLRDASHRVDVAGTLEEANQLWQMAGFDAVLLDLNLPHSAHPRSGLGSGLTALKAARSRGDRTPVLVLTARNRTDERIAGLNAGADDYLGKPFDLAEVEARLRAVVRRTTGTQDQVQVGGLSLDRQNRRFAIHGQPLDLPAREFEVLWELMTPAGPRGQQARNGREAVGPRGLPGRQRARGLHLARAQEAGRQRRAHPHAARAGLPARGRGLTRA